MPLLAFVFRVLGRKIYILKMENHLQPSIPELFLQIHEHKILILAIIIQETFISSLFRRTEAVRVTLDKRITCKVYEVYSLIHVSWRFEVNDCTVEEWNEHINESFSDAVQGGVVQWVNIVNVAFNAAKKLYVK